MSNRVNLLALIVIFIFSFILRIFILYDHFQKPSFAIQQDNYADYAKAIKNHDLNNPNNFSPSDTRLFPGYPIVISIVLNFVDSPINSGLIISLASSLFCIFLVFLLTKNLLVTFLFSFFPPVWLISATKVANEPLTCLLLLTGLFCLNNKRYFLFGLVIGLAATVRLISVCLLFAAIITLIRQRKTVSLKLILGFLIGFGLLFLFNYYHFGWGGLFKQFMVYPKVAGTGGFSMFGLSTIIGDIFRTIDWHQYRILLSGLFYLLINFASLVIFWKKRNSSPIFYLYFYWLLFSNIFIFSLAPIPLLEEYGRFTIPHCVLIAIAAILVIQDKLKPVAKKRAKSI